MAERKKERIVIERRNDSRTYLARNGEITFNHTYYALADGTYGYLADQVLGIDLHQRIGNDVCQGWHGRHWATPTPRQAAS